jgi:hypothetical protein
MTKRLTIAALLLTAVVPSTASAGVFVGLRAGYALPFGDVEGGAPLADQYEAMIPITLDLGLKLGKALAVGAYGGFGIGRLAGTNDCAATAGATGCRASQLRGGVQLNLHASNSEKSEFWGGVAAGFTQLWDTGTPGTGDLDVKTFGLEASLQGGLDLVASPSFRIGLYAAATAGQFTQTNDGITRTEIADKAFHFWLQAGVRGLYGD